jgi:hypothetical protein
VAEILIESITCRQPPLATFQRIAKHYPNASRAEIDAAMAAAKAEVAKRQRELDSMKALEAIVKPIMRELGNEGLTIGRALKIAANRGDERAKAYLAYFEHDEAKAWERDFKDAVALDPYWEMRDDSVAVRKPGGLHKTPEELVAAYRASKGAI